MSDVPSENIQQVERLLEMLNLAHEAPRSTNPPAPDVHVTLADGRSIALELTIVKVDEVAGAGSALRAKEEVLAKRAAGRAYSMWSDLNFMPALEHRMRAKAQKAASYRTDTDAELWLLVTGSVPKPGALASTFIPWFLLDQEDLNKRTHELLAASR